MIPSEYGPSQKSAAAILRSTSRIGWPPAVLFSCHTVLGPHSDVWPLASCANGRWTLLADIKLMRLAMPLVLRDQDLLSSIYWTFASSLGAERPAAVPQACDCVSMALLEHTTVSQSINAKLFGSEVLDRRGVMTFVLQRWRASDPPLAAKVTMVRVRAITN